MKIKKISTCLLIVSGICFSQANAASSIYNIRYYTNLPSGMQLNTAGFYKPDGSLSPPVGFPHPRVDTYANNIRSGSAYVTTDLDSEFSKKWPYKLAGSLYNSASNEGFATSEISGPPIVYNSVLATFKGNILMNILPSQTQPAITYIAKDITLAFVRVGAEQARQFVPYYDGDKPLTGIILAAKGCRKGSAGKLWCPAEAYESGKRAPSMDRTIRLGTWDNLGGGSMSYNLEIKLV